MAIDQTTVLGLRAAAAAFRQLEPIAREAFNEATARTAQNIVTAAKSALVPGHGFRTGALRNALAYSMSKTTGQARVGIAKNGAVFVPGRHGSASTAAGAKAYRPTTYGHLVEFGHGGPHAASAKPFQVPAAEGQRSFFLSMCRQAGATIERDMSRIGLRTL